MTFNSSVRLWLRDPRRLVFPVNQNRLSQSMGIALLNDHKETLAFIWPHIECPMKRRIDGSIGRKEGHDLAEGHNTGLDEAEWQRIHGMIAPLPDLASITCSPRSDNEAKVFTCGRRMRQLFRLSLSLPSPPCRHAFMTDCIRIIIIIIANKFWPNHEKNWRITTSCLERFFPIMMMVMHAWICQGYHKFQSGPPLVPEMWVFMRHL